MTDPVRRRGLLLALVSPSGAGKSTLSRLLRDQERNLGLSVSVTTRQKRPSEVDGVHYHFKTIAEFERMRERDALLEWAKVHGNFYGTPRDPVEEALGEGRDILLDVDWQGAQQIGEALPNDLVSIFILPPSAAALEERLTRRAEDDHATIQRRLKNAKEELTHFVEHEYVVVNDQLEPAFDSVRAILNAERQKRQRMEGLQDLVSAITEAL